MSKQQSARLHSFTPRHTTLAIHPKVLSAYKTWLKYRPKTSPIHLTGLDKYHRPLTRIIYYDKNHYFYFDNFERMSNVFQYEMNISQPFVIIIGNDQQVTKAAWAEVLKLCFYKNVDHVSLWEHLQEHCSATTLKELMGCDSLYNEDYCSFAGINMDQYSYAQKSLKQSKETFDLAQNTDWIDE